jgi:glutamate 5-kinase
MQTETVERLRKARRVVVKVGSNVLTQKRGLNHQAVQSISRQICQLIDNKREIILVSSGAMASGLGKVGLDQRPDEIPKRQAIAAIGQAGLIMEYENAFAEYEKKVAQILLTSEDLSSRKRYLNARNTLYTLLAWQVVPIINENDTIMVEEIKVGDNDNLAAMITLLMDADLLINLTDIDGLFTKDPRTQPDAELIATVETITKHIQSIAGGIPGPLGRGGMLSKIKAARKVTAAGIPMIIANGGRPDILVQLLEGHPYGTYFVPKTGRLASRKRWIGFTLKPQGAIAIDKGAADAVLEKGKSLLPSGIIAVDGDFRIGAPVEVRTAGNEVLATGLVNYSAAEIRQIKGLKSGQIKGCLGHKPYDEVIHRDNLVVTIDR